MFVCLSLFYGQEKENLFVSISSDCLSFGGDSLGWYTYNFDSISGVGISFGNGVDYIFSGILNGLLVLCYLLDELVMSNKLIIKERRSHACSRALDTIGELIEWTNSIISVHATHSLSVETTNKCEGIVWHESSAIKSISNKLSHALSVRLSFMLSFVDLNFCDHVFVQGFDICDHTTRGDDALLREFSGLAVFSWKNSKSFRDSSISSNGHEVLTSDGYTTLIKIWLREQCKGTETNTYLW